MKRIIFGAAALVLGSFTIAAAPVSAQAAARHYDCTKPGNKNKAACKGATTAPAAKPTPAHPAPAAHTKTAKVATAPVAVATPKPRAYDCAKAGNANKAACKGALTPAVAPKPHATIPTHVAPVPHAAPVSVAKPAAAGQETHPNGPNGATALCKDGTYSHSAHRSGTCARHKGVQTWY